MPQHPIPSIAPALTAALVGLFSAVPVPAAPVSVVYSAITTTAFDGQNSDDDVDGATAYGQRSLQSVQGGNRSTLLVDWKDTGSGALFDFDFEHSRSGDLYAYSYVLQNALYFRVGAQDIRYALSGLYAALTGSQRTFSYVELADQTTGEVLFRDLSYSDRTMAESFTLGVANDGDSGNVTLGSLTGTLHAGRMYGLFINNYIQARDTPDGGATAQGCVSLAIGGAALDGECGVAAERASAASVPEPGTLALAGLALAGLGALRRRVAPDLRSLSERPGPGSGPRPAPA